ncbi:hypothetical protein V8C42DRAFT_223872 [Trichoderma barbatum]
MGKGGGENPEKLGTGNGHAQPPQAAQPLQPNTKNNQRLEILGQAKQAPPTRTGDPVPTPVSDPRQDKVSGITWAQRAGGTKPRETINENTNASKNATTAEHTDENQQTARTNKNRNKTKNKRDGRILLRVPPDHLWRRISIIGVKQELLRLLDFHGEEVSEIKQTRTGFAIQMKNKTLTEKLMSFNEAIAAKGVSLEDWKTFLVKGVPKSFTNTSGTQDTDTLIPIEAETSARAKLPPARCARAPFGETDATANWFISFTEEVKKGLQSLFFGPTGGMGKKG